MSGLEKFMSRLGFGKAETEDIRNVVSNQEEVSSGIGSENVDKKGTDPIDESKKEKAEKEQVDSTSNEEPVNDNVKVYQIII